MFNFDPTIKLGDVLQIASFVGLGIAAYYNVRSKLDIHSFKLSTIEKTMESNAATLTLVATQKVEIEHMKKTIDEMKHGVGFIVER